MARVVSPQERKVMDSVKKETCELCGSAKGCEVHHIIPAVLGGSTTEENLITVCSVCHAKLTPRNELIKIGIRKAKLKNIPLIFYQSCEDACEKGWLDAEGIMDIFDRVMQYAEAVENGLDKEFRR